MFTLAASTAPRSHSRVRAKTGNIVGSASIVVPPPRSIGRERHAVVGRTRPRKVSRSSWPACRPRALWSRCGFVLYEITEMHDRTRASVRFACRSCVVTMGTPPLA